MPKRVLVTAGASGIGAAIALRLVAEGYEVVVADIDAVKGDALATAAGLRFVACDAAREEDLVSLVHDVGAVEILVNNAGIAGPTKPLTEVSTEEWNQTFAVNVTSHFIAAREMVPLMRKAGGGLIVNLSSVAAKIGYAGRSPYGASKKAVLGLTAALAREVAKDGIRANAILPGAVRGERIARVVEAYAAAENIPLPEAEAWYLRRQATGAYVEPEEIAAMVVHLASEAGRSITGQFISIDGGFE